MPADLILLTESRYERPAEITPFVADLLEEDRLLAEALARRGIACERVDWARPDVDWAAAPALFRSTWDYFCRWDEFSAWLERASALTRLVNPAELVRWNADKHYLGELAARGVPVVPTRFCDRGSGGSLAELLAEAGWDEAVLKPAISGGSRHTYRLRRGAVSEADERRFRELSAAEDMLLQPFVEGVAERGEVTLVFFGGELSHALRKVPRPGDFRVQSEFGGTLAPHDPSAAEREIAAAAIAACPTAPVYGRVDLVQDERGEPAVMEVEVVEPELWLRLCPAAAERFADVVAAAL